MRVDVGYRCLTLESVPHEPNHLGRADRTTNMLNVSQKLCGATKSIALVFSTKNIPPAKIKLGTPTRGVN